MLYMLPFQSRIAALPEQVSGKQHQIRGQYLQG